MTAQRDTFWHSHPITDLNQRYHSDVVPIGFYPNAKLHNVHGQTEKVKASYAGKFTTDKLDEIIQWCGLNCRGRWTWSSNYGSVAFEMKEDAVLFLMFFADVTMPEPEIAEPTYPWQYYHTPESIHGILGPNEEQGT